MINPQELRIGNLVEFKGQVVPILKIDSMNEFIDDGKLIYKGSVTVPEYLNYGDRRIWNYNSPWIDHISAVQLTEDWLKAAGFELYSDYDYRNYVLPKYYFCVGMWNSDERPGGFEEKGAFYWGDQYSKIETVHRLQNLVFALYGTELTINR